MGAKNLRIFTIILNILISIATESQIELTDLKKIKTDNFKLNDFLIYPTPASFKYIILPFLSAEHVIMTYYYFKNFLPNLDLSKWLEFFRTTTVLNIAEEHKSLYWVPSSPSKPILYSHKSKTAVIFEIENFNPRILDFRPEAHCALLPSGILMNLRPRTLASGAKFMVAEDFSEYDFFVTDENFVTIASGKVNLNEFFSHYLNYLEEMHNLKFWKKLILKIRYIVTIPFKKYFEFIFPLLVKSHIFLYQIPCDFLFARLGDYIVMPFIVIWYIAYLFIYHIIIFPFRVLIIPAGIYLSDFTFTTFCACPVILFLFCACFFPTNIDDFLIPSMASGEIVLELSSFEIHPQNNNKIKLIPFLFPREKSCWFYLALIVFEFIFSLFFKPLFKHWI